eukprot:85683-Prymnesium_polylepis.1
MPLTWSSVGKGNPGGLGGRAGGGGAGSSKDTSTRPQGPLFHGWVPKGSCRTLVAIIAAALLQSSSLSISLALVGSKFWRGRLRIHPVNCHPMWPPLAPSQSGSKYRYAGCDDPPMCACV